MTLMDIVEHLDSFPYDKVPSALYGLYTHDREQIIGYITPFTVAHLKRYTEVFHVEGQIVYIDSSLNTVELRDRALNDVAVSLRSQGTIDSLKGWRDELYTVYYPEHVAYMNLERSFCPLLGVVMYGIHVNGYVPPSVSKSGGYEFWIPRRSLTKQTFPGMLDNTIAGGLGYPYGVMETVLKESYEEGGLSEQFVKDNIISAGCMSYYYEVTPGVYDKDDCFVQPEFQYIFDLPFDSDTVPVPVDMEAEQFFLMTLDEALDELDKGKFKPNCGVVFIDFLIRHGIITEANEKDYIHLVQRSHRRLPFPLR